MSKSIYILLFLFSVSLYSQKVKPKTIAVLSDSIRETSGLIAFDGLLWTHNDDHDTTLYGLDTLGKIKKQVRLTQVQNQDWEEISQDAENIYLGDFGNNYQGNRTNLHILKIAKKTFYDAQPKIDTISFRYENQTDFSAVKPNSTDFDCEAFVVTNDSVYLFTKQWKSKQSNVYVLPNQVGDHIAKLKTTLPVKGLITGATRTTDGENVILCGYSKKGKPFLYWLPHFFEGHFSETNLKRIRLQLPFHQIEGIATFDGSRFYLTNEKLILKPIINVAPQLYEVDLSSFLKL
ncbi:T9SS C-terminal target domain-containing protein [Flavobacterium agrisoli]|uniref:T9SS C-terminal target domain-containing protein n=1 Tax=Flavobacterium agrisoli TaxID=2793066 RepID=A0A934UJW2_9FLAO|nr:T9SS C-terminal target domain-containing protein [Flavobacterium agrisoli]MBK0369933.1 T9SS C-terminal target domain-containing protein [Flavobacterium agrisoli]